MNFDDALSMNMDDIKRPPNAPPGTYRLRVMKNPDAPRDQQSAKGKWKVIDFQLKLIEPQEDVDRDDLEKYGDISAAPPVRLSFMFDTENDTKADQTMFFMKQFLREHLGLDNMPLKQALANCANQECMGFIQLRPDPNNAEIMYTEVKKTMPIT